MSRHSLRRDVVVGGHRVRAVSIGGLETAIDLPDLDVAFDVGRCPPWLARRRTILFTHSHIDHMGGIASHAATRGLLHMRPPVYVVPRESVNGLRRAFEAWRELDGSELEHELVPLGPGEEYRLSDGLRARAFRSYHRAPCQGYALTRVRRKLRPEYRGLSSRDVRRLRVDEGVKVSEEVRETEVAFVGDSSFDVVERERVVRRAHLLILEVTFLDDRVPVEKSREMGHVHLDEVVAGAELFRNRAILFTHFSARYRSHEILRLLDEKLPPGLRERVTPLLNGHGDEAESA